MPENLVQSQTVVLLPLGETLEASLDCPQGECMIRFRIHVPSDGVLKVEVNPVHVSDTVALRVVLKDLIQRVLGIARLGDENHLEIESPVEAGPHQVLIQSIGGEIPFEVIVTFEGGGDFMDQWR